MEEIKNTIPAYLERTIKEHPYEMSFTEFDPERSAWAGMTWKSFGELKEKWQAALQNSGAVKGDRIAVLLPNSTAAAVCDMSILSNGLVPVPLHAVDTPKSSAFIINNSEAKILFVPKALRWNAIVSTGEAFPNLKLVVVVSGDLENTENSPVPVVTIKDWLAQAKGVKLEKVEVNPEDLAAIVYTSGTTGKPKGVMLTHNAITHNVLDCDELMHIKPDDVFLSFLPFSHTFERTAGFYLPTFRGAHVVFARSVLTLPEDMQIHKPTIFITVPRIYERFLSKIEDKLAKSAPEVRAIAQYAFERGYERFCQANGLKVDPSLVSLEARQYSFEVLDEKFRKEIRKMFGGRIRLSFVGGAALSKHVGEFFCAMGVDLFQGYGLTECSPVISVNRAGRNDPTTVGDTLPTWTARIGENDELQMKGPSVMKGYWKRPDATKEAFTEDGWLRTGDKVEITPTGHIRIKGRIKEIIVTSTGEKIAPSDLELSIQKDPLFEQVMAVGENRPFITCLAVVNPDEYQRFCAELGVDPNDPETINRRDVRSAALKRIRKAASDFPQYGVPRNVILLKEPWGIENGLLTVTMKLKRKAVAERYAKEIEELYTTPQAR